MSDIAVVAYAARQEPVVDGNEIEMMGPVIEAVRASSGLTPDDIDFTCSGSSRGSPPTTCASACA